MCYVSVAYTFHITVESCGDWRLYRLHQLHSATSIKKVFNTCFKLFRSVYADVYFVHVVAIGPGRRAPWAGDRLVWLASTAEPRLCPTSLQNSSQELTESPSSHVAPFVPLHAGWDHFIIHYRHWTSDVFTGLSVCLSVYVSLSVCVSVCC